METLLIEEIVVQEPILEAGFPFTLTSYIDNTTGTLLGPGMSYDGCPLTHCSVELMSITQPLSGIIENNEVIRLKLLVNINRSGFRVIPRRISFFFWRILRIQRTPDWPVPESILFLSHIQHFQIRQFLSTLHLL